MRRGAVVGCDAELAPAPAEPAVGRIAATAASTATPQMAEPRARRAIGPGPEAIDIDRTTSPQARSGRQRLTPQDGTPVSRLTKENTPPRTGSLAGPGARAPRRQAHRGEVRLRHPIRASATTA